jgi:aspartate/methionine/tyrosine aminotransferase
LLGALANPHALDYDPQPRGLLAAREAVCNYYSGQGVEVDPSQIVLTTSTSEAYSFLFRLLCDTNDEIVVLQPGYPLFDFLAGLDDVQLKFAPFVYDQGWQIDFNGLRSAISPRTRAIVLVHPNNPTGHFTKEWEALELAAICRELHLSIIVDEVFLDYSLHPIDAPGPSLLGIRDGSRLSKPVRFAAGLEAVPVFVVSGLSKIAGLPQMKAAWIVATGPERQAALDRLEVIADTFLSMNAPVQWALPAWLDSAPKMQEQIRERVAANLAELDRRLGAASAVSRLAFEGGWYAVLRIPALEPDEKTVLNLLERGALVHPGYFFGLPEEGSLVVSLLGPQLEFSHGVGVMIDYFRKDQRSNTDGGAA